MIIAFFGPDGSGKTTLSTLLSIYLENNGYKTKITWLRGNHTIAYILTRVFFKQYKVQNKKTSFPYRIPEQASFLWIFLQWIGAIIKVFWSTLIGKLYVIIYERSTVDLLVWLIMTTRTNVLNYIFGRHLLYIAMRADAIIFTTATISVLLFRRRESEYELSLRLQAKLYNVLANILIPTLTLDTSNTSKYKCLKKIINYLIHEKAKNTNRTLK